MTTKLLAQRTMWTLLNKPGLNKPVLNRPRRKRRGFPVSYMIPVLLLIAYAGVVLAEADHRTGFVRYARVDRADDTYREMFIDEATLDALRSGRPLSDGATILMESHYQPGEIGSVFAKRRENGRWLYESFGPGEALPEFQPRPQCSGCHRAAAASDGMFTLRMLQRFVAAGEPQHAKCERSGRVPCDVSVYEAR